MHCQFGFHFIHLLIVQSGKIDFGGQLGQHRCNGIAAIVPAVAAQSAFQLLIQVTLAHSPEWLGSVPAKAITWEPSVFWNMQKSGVPMTPPLMLP